MNAHTNQLGLTPLRWRQYTVSVDTNAKSLAEPAVSVIWHSGGSAGYGDYPHVEVGAHSFRVGDLVQVAGCHDPFFNGRWRVHEVVSGSLFSIYVPGAGGREEPDTNTCTVWLPSWAQQAVVRSKTGTVLLGPDSTCGWASLAAGSSIALDVPHGAKFNLGEWFAKVASGTGSVEVLYI